MEEDRKRTVVLTVSSLLLVAMVVAAVVIIVTKDDDGNREVSTSKKAIQNLCDSVDYQDRCVKCLSSKEYNQTDDPKELVKIGFKATMKMVKEALNKSVAMEKHEQDPRSKEALRSCNELADTSLRDLDRSFQKFSNLDIADLNASVADLKVWLSGAMTYEETCLDGFKKVTGEAGKKIGEILKSGMEMTANTLAMVTKIATAFATINEKPPANSRRLLSYPDWLDPTNRKLLQDAPKAFEANVIVAQDGSGKYKTINEALNDIPKSSKRTFVIQIKEGVYEEKVEILSSMTNVLLIGDGPDKTRITGKSNVVDGTTTYKSATVAVHGDNFIAKDIGFENSAGAEKEQAVALRVSADKTIFYNCWMDGYQDTLYTHTYRQYYRDCAISGTIDFVFGDASVLFQNCIFLVRKPLEKQNCIVTAQGRKNVRQPTGIILQNCTITADTSLKPVKNNFKTYLARPWKQYSRTVIMESYIDDVIQSEGYLPWNDTFALSTLFYTEFNNRGPSSSKDKRVKWPGIKELTTERIKRFTATHFIDGDLWIPRTKVPYASSLIQPPPTKEPVSASPISAEEDIDFNHTQTKQESALISELRSARPPPNAPPRGPTSPPPKSNPPKPNPGPGSNSSSGSAPAQAPTFHDSPKSKPSPSSNTSTPGPESDTPFDFGLVFNSQPKVGALPSPASNPKLASNPASVPTSASGNTSAPVPAQPSTSSTSTSPKSNSSLDSGSVPKSASPSTSPSSSSDSGLASKGASSFPSSNTNSSSSSSSGGTSKGASSPLPPNSNSSSSPAPKGTLPSPSTSSNSSSGPAKSPSPTSSLGSSTPNSSSFPNSSFRTPKSASSPSPSSTSSSGSGTPKSDSSPNSSFTPKPATSPSTSPTSISGSPPPKSASSPTSSSDSGTPKSVSSSSDSGTPKSVSSSSDSDTPKSVSSSSDSGTPKSASSPTSSPSSGTPKSTASPTSNSSSGTLKSAALSPNSRSDTPKSASSPSSDSGTHKSALSL